MSDLALAPIALFAFKRPDHTRRALEALSLNREFDLSPLFVFCDGSRSEKEAIEVAATRRVVESWPHPNKRIVYAPSNRGLASSISDGVNELCQEFGRVIVVEDDLIVSTSFLTFLNEALVQYADDARVMQIGAHMFPVDLAVDDDAIFLPILTSWGWATWKRAWPNRLRNKDLAQRVLSSVRSRFQFDFAGAYPYARLLADQIQGKKDSWAVWFYLHIFLAGGLVLYPTKSLVNNEGFDGSGTNCEPASVESMILSNRSSWRFPAVQVSRVAARTLRRFLISDRGLLRFAKDNYWRFRGHRGFVAEASQ